MKGFLHWLGMRFHAHNWEIHEIIPVKVYYENGYGDEKRLRESFRKAILRCKVCGELKTKDLRA